MPSTGRLERFDFSHGPSGVSAGPLVIGPSDNVRQECDSFNPLVAGCWLEVEIDQGPVDESFTWSQDPTGH